LGRRKRPHAISLQLTLFILWAGLTYTNYGWYLKNLNNFMGFNAWLCGYNARPPAARTGFEAFSGRDFLDQAHFAAGHELVDIHQDQHALVERVPGADSEESGIRVEMTAGASPFCVMACLT
jgi:hypothetical protein